jgi:hypothetical protein
VDLTTSATPDAAKRLSAAHPQLVGKYPPWAEASAATGTKPRSAGQTRTDQVSLSDRSDEVCGAAAVIVTGKGSAPLRAYRTA